MKPKIRFIYFDVGGVLLHWRASLEALAKTCNQSLTKVSDVFWRHEEFSLRGKITPKKLGENIFKELAVAPKDWFDFSQFSMHHFAPIRKSHEFVKKISKHYPIGLLTNISSGYFKLCLTHKHIPDLPYQVVVESCRLGYVKPEKEIYLHAQKKAGVAHGEILFADDDPDNIRAAQLLDWQTVLFETDNPEKSLEEIRRLLTPS